MDVDRRWISCEVLEEYQSSSASSGTTQLGALLRAQLNGSKSE